MPDANGWPDASKPGVPLNPERDGWHWVGNVTREWVAQFQMWCDRHGYSVPPATWGVLPYGGPCLLPSEVAAREAAARAEGKREGIEAAAKRVDSIEVPHDLRDVRREFYTAIRALLEEPGHE